MSDLAGDRRFSFRFRLQPRLECVASLLRICKSLQSRFGILNVQFGGGDFCLRRSISHDECWCRNGGREIRIQTRFGDVVEEGRELVILLLAERVVLVIVAAATLHRQTQECRCESLRPVGDVLDAKLFRHAAAFNLLRMQPVESRRQNLFVGRIGQQVTSELLGDELVVGHVAIERADHPVSPRPDETIAVDLITVRVAVPGRVQPVRRHSLTVR